MKVLIKFFIIIFPAILVAQANEIIQNKNYQSIIFSKTYKSPYYTFLNENSRFTPSRKDIELFELNLKKKVKLINKKQWNQEGSCPIIHRNLYKYNRNFFDNIIIYKQQKKITFLKMSNTGLFRNI